MAIKRLLCGQVEDKSIKQVSSSNHVLITIVIAWSSHGDRAGQFFAEMEILANARHDNIVRFLGGCVQPSNLCILFEFCPQARPASPSSGDDKTSRSSGDGRDL